MQSSKLPRMSGWLPHISCCSSCNFNLISWTYDCRDAFLMSRITVFYSLQQAKHDITGYHHILYGPQTQDIRDTTICFAILTSLEVLLLYCCKGAYLEVHKEWNWPYDMVQYLSILVWGDHEKKQASNAAILEIFLKWFVCHLIAHEAFQANLHRMTQNYYGKCAGCAPAMSRNRSTPFWW